MAEIIRYVDPDVSGGLGDGTSWANAYTSLSAWNGAEATNLVTDGDTHVVRCRSSAGTADTTSVNISSTNWTTDSTHYITVEVVDDHQGVLDTSIYRLQTSTAFDASLKISASYTVVEGLQVGNSGGNSNGIQPSGTSIVIDKAIIHQYSNLGVDDRGTNTVVVNSVIYGGTKGIDKASSGGDLYVYNCTVVNNSSYGIEGGAFRGTYVKNCYVGGSGATDLYEPDGNSLITPTTTYTEDGSDSTPTAAFSTIGGAFFVNITPGTEDLNIQSGSDLIGVGTDLSSDATYSFSDDIQGNARSSWDVGAFEFQAGGLPILLTPILDGEGDIITSLTIEEAVSITGIFDGEGTIQASLSVAEAISLSPVFDGEGDILAPLTVADEIQLSAIIDGQGDINTTLTVIEENPIVLSAIIDGVGDINATITVAGTGDYYKAISTNGKLTTSINTKADLITALTTKSDLTISIETKGEIG